MRRSLVFLASIACACACAGRPASMPAPAAESDAAQAFRDAIDMVLAVHPDPFRHVSRPELDALIAEEHARLVREAEPGELALGRALHRVFAAIGDFHLLVGLGLYQRPDPISVVPVLPVQIGERVLVDASRPALPVGTELVAIDGVPIAEVYDEVGALVVVDGRNPVARQRLLEHDFGKHYHLRYGMRARYRLTVRRPDAEPEDIEVVGADRADVGALLRGRQSQPRRGVLGPTEGPPWPSLEEVGDGVALLRAPAFGVGDMAGFARRVDALMAQARGARALIVDVRGNQGGLRPNAIAILDHLMPGPYRQWTAMSTRVLRVPERYRARVTFPYGTDEQRLVPAFSGHAHAGGFRVEGDPLAGAMRPGAAPFAGPVVVLVDGLTNSAANSFVLALARYRPGTVVVGEELGGGCARHVGELPVVYRTGYRDVVVMVSLIAIEHVQARPCREGRGMMPEVTVDYTTDDFLAGRDPHLVRALSLLKE